MEEEEEDRPPTGDFVYQYPFKGNIYRLNLPLKLPYEGNAREHAVRLVKAHKIPFHLEEDLEEKLNEFSKSATSNLLDELAESRFYGGSVFEKGSDTDTTIEKWTKDFTENCAHFSAPSDKSYASNETTFSEIYYKLIHSPALETLLQLEHTYAMAVEDVITAWENARDIMEKRQDSNLAKAMEALGTFKSERDINALMRQYTLEREACEVRWSNELNQLRESQQREYRDWVTKVHEDMECKDEKDKGKVPILSPPKPRSLESSVSSASSDNLLNSVKDAPPLEESFTVNLGARKKTMHNIRLIRGNPLSFCRYQQRAGVGDQVWAGPNPECLQTAMSLYSNRLSALVLMVDRRVNSLIGIKEAFANICRHSTDFHFPDIDSQLASIQENTLIANVERRERPFISSITSSSSGSPLSSNLAQDDSSSSLNNSSSNKPHPPATPSSGSGEGMLGSGAMVAGTGVWSGGGRREEQDKTVSSSQEKSVNLEPGDFYLTKHSNLSQVHAVFHLVTDEVDVMSPSLKARHSIMTGLKNCLRVATRHDVFTITVPLLLIHNMRRLSTRAETDLQKALMLGYNTEWSSLQIPGDCVKKARRQCY